MPVRRAEAVWEGGLRSGKGTVRFGGGTFEGAYSFSSRFEEGAGTNPEELIAAAHAGCFSMAFSAGLEKAGYTPRRVATFASVAIEKVGEGFQITRIHLDTEAEVPGISEADFQRLAEEAKAGCPVSRALQAVEITLNARLVG